MVIESVSANACDATRNRYGGQTLAICESNISNACDATRNRDGGQTVATMESTRSNACDAVRDNRIFTTGNKRISRCFDNRITVSAIIRGVSIRNDHACQTGATPESRLSNACDAVGNGDARWTGAIIESIISNAGDACGVGDACQTGAIFECFKC